MMLSPHFALAEFTTSRDAAAHGIDNTPSPAIVEMLKVTAHLLEEVRLVVKAPILITSGFRCHALNELEGGAGSEIARRINPRSQPSAHLFGRAADFICPGYGDPLSVCSKISATEGIDFDQLIFEYGGWTHIAWADKPRLMCLTIDRQGTREGFG